MRLAWLFQARLRLQIPFWNQRSAASFSSTSIQHHNLTESRLPRQRECAVTLLVLSSRLQDFESLRWVLMMFVGPSIHYSSAPRKAPESLAVRSRTATLQTCLFLLKTRDNSLYRARQCSIQRSIRFPVAQSPCSECGLDSPQNVDSPRHTALPISLPFASNGICSSHRALSLLTHSPNAGSPSGASRQAMYSRRSSSTADRDWVNGIHLENAASKALSTKTCEPF